MEPPEIWEGTIHVLSFLHSSVLEFIGGDFSVNLIKKVHGILN